MGSFTCLHVCAWLAYMAGSQKMAFNPLKMERMSAMWVPGTEPRYLEEQTVLLTAESPLQACKDYFKDESHDFSKEHIVGETDTNVPCKLYHAPFNHSAAYLYPPFQISVVLEYMCNNNTT